MSARCCWWLAACLAAGCAHGSTTAPPSTPLLASISPLSRPPTAESGRYGLVVTMSLCWYPVAITATAHDASPRLDPHRCRSIGERVVADIPDAAMRERVERLTIEDVALKLERPNNGESDTN
ncbi:MAG: hypothetical protein ACXVCV_05995 [Polyangia bacterium]